jgi:uncharacterized protein (TIGR02421 family)
MSPAFAPEDLAVDRGLAEISQSFRFLLDLSPVNAEEARDRFLGSADDEPAFEYRALEDDPAVLRAELEAVDIESVSDHTLAHFVQAKRRELELQIEMLACRCTADFRGLSIELFGTVSPALLEQAEEILVAVDRPAPQDGACLDAEAFARLAEAELDHYRAIEPDLSAHVEIRSDSSGVMVADGDLLIAPSTRVTPTRATALLHHEIGTHILTYVNGCHQPLRLLAAGLAGYEETQEGLALLAEHLSGGFTPSRLRQIAARVVAVHRMVDGASFRCVHDELVAAGFSPPRAFRITMRVFRSGGLTKDLVYLRGLVALVAHVHSGHGLDVLWLGKMPLSDVPLVEGLVERGALAKPLLRPRYLDDPAAAPRQAALERAESVVELIGR